MVYGVTFFLKKKNLVLLCVKYNERGFFTPCDLEFQVFYQANENLEVNIKLKLLKKSNRLGGRSFKFLAKWEVFQKMESGAFAYYLSISASQRSHNLLKLHIAFFQYLSGFYSH